jgi:hypothetical protein
MDPQAGQATLTLSGLGPGPVTMTWSSSSGLNKENGLDAQDVGRAVRF